MCVPPKTWNIAREPLLAATYLIKNTPIFKGSKSPAKEAIAFLFTEASRPQRKQLLPLVLKEANSKEAISKEAISKEAISKEAISKEAIPKEAIPKKAILNAPTSFHPLPPKDENNHAHNKIP
jgi:hypothetical protein